MPAGAMASSSGSEADQAVPTWAAMDETARREYWASLALRHCRGLGARSRARLLHAFGSAYQALQARQRWAEGGLNKRQAAEMSTGSWRVTAREEWDQARCLDAGILLWTDARYPRQLRELPDAPVLLYCRGDISLLQAPAFAIVGSRRATSQGLAVAAYMARCLAACGITVVSGMAQGIDSVAHEAALARVGRSIGILGTGIDQIYPRSGEPLFRAMAEQGLLLSEFPPGAPPLAEHFPIRNRIISGLALGVLVVEAASRSGSLITARLALEQNRDVYAVPGPALDSHCLGCQELVRQGARPVFSAEDVLRDLAAQLQPFGISAASLPEAEKALTLPVRPGEDTNPEQAAAPSEKNRDVGSAVPPIPVEIPCVEAEALVPPDRKERLLHCLRGQGPMQADALAVALDMPIHELNALLIGLEMLGRVKRLPGARYEAPA